MTQYRITGAGVAQFLVRQARESHRDYWNVIKLSDAHINGRKPRDPRKLKEANQSWSANRNYGKAKARIESGSEEATGQSLRAFYLSSVIFRRPEQKELKEPETAFLGVDVAKEFYAAHLADAFITSAMRDPRFHDHLVKIEYNALAYGYCPLTTESDQDYLGTPCHVASVAFEDRSKSDDIRTWCIFDSIKHDRLWRIWDELGLISKTTSWVSEDGLEHHFYNGWCMEALKEILVKALKLPETEVEEGVTTPEGTNNNEPDWENVMQYYTERRGECIMNTSNVRYVKIWTREFDGSITETYYALNEATVDDPESSAGNQYLLYRKHYPRCTVADKMTIVRDSSVAPNGYIQEMRGIARWAVEDSIDNNKHRNQLKDRLTLSAPVWQQPSTKQGKKFALSVHQAFSLAPPGFQPLPNQPQFNPEAHLLALQYEEQGYLRDTSHFDNKIGNRLSSRPTKDEISARSAESGQAYNAKLNVKFSDYARYFYLCLNRLIDCDPDKNSAAEGVKKEFFEEMRWRLRGLLPDDTKGADKAIKLIVKSVKHFNMDRIVDDPATLQRALAFAETPFERRRLQRMMLLAEGFSRADVAKMKPIEFDAADELNHQRNAAYENDMFYRTREVVFRETDDPVIHMDTHLAKLNRVFELVKTQKMSPLEGLKFSDNMLSHLPKHLQQFSRPLYKQLEKKYSDLMKKGTDIAVTIAQIAKEFMKQQEKAKQQGEQAKLDPVQLAKIEMLKISSDTKLARSAEQQEFRKQQKEEEFARAEARKDSEHGEKMRREEEQASLKNKLKVLETTVNQLTANANTNTD